jgi:hypothetical protein
MKKLFTLIAVAAMAFAVQAAELTVANGTDVNQYIPFRATYLNWPPYFGQVIYPASQLTEMEGKDITAMTFYIANENGNVMNGGELSFFLGVVDVSQFSDVSPFRIPESDLTLVKALPMTPGETEIVVNFDTPFAYEGGNLALMVSVTQAGTFSGTGYFYGVNSDVPSAVYGGNSFVSERFYPKTTFTYEEGSTQTAVTLLSQANALEDDTEFMFNGDAVVTVFKNGYLFVRDATGHGQISNVVDGSFENGQVLSQGWSATKTSVDGWAKFTDAVGLSASGETNAELGAPQVVTSLDESMLNAYVCFENVTVSLFTRSIKLEDGTSIPMFNMFNLNMPASGFPGMSDRHHNAYGIIGMQSGVLKFIPVDFEEYVEPAILRGDVNGDKMVDIDDVTALISYVLTGNADGINIDNAECNQVDGIDIDDVTALNNYLLNGSW